jgi:hypothetical protein
MPLLLESCFGRAPIAQLSWTSIGHRSNCPRLRPSPPKACPWVKQLLREKVLPMYSVVPPAFFGTAMLFIAGFVRGGATSSPDPELVFGATYALGGLGLAGLVAAGVALGIRLGRE